MPKIDAEKLNRRAIFRKSVWSTRLGFGAKITLVALGDISQVDGIELRAPAKAFHKISHMIGRDLSNVVRIVDRLQKQKILLIEPSECGYRFEFHPENEMRQKDSHVEAAA